MQWCLRHRSFFMALALVAILFNRLEPFLKFWKGGSWGIFEWNYFKSGPQWCRRCGLKKKTTTDRKSITFEHFVPRWADNDNFNYPLLSASLLKLLAVALCWIKCDPRHRKTWHGNTVKPVLSRHSKRRPKIVFQDRLLLYAGQKCCRMLQESILQYFQPSLSYHLSLHCLPKYPFTGLTGQGQLVRFWYLLHISEAIL